MRHEPEVVMTGSIVSADGTRIGYRRLGRVDREVRRGQSRAGWVLLCRRSRFRSRLALLTYFCGFKTIAAALRLFFGQ